MKTVLVTLSVVNGAMGLFLVGRYFWTDTSALPVIILAFGLILQGGYTLVYLFGRLERIEPWSGRTLLVGETLALVLGGLILVASGLNNIAPPDSDYEYGPFVVGALIAVQALTALVTYADVKPTRLSTPSA